MVGNRLSTFNYSFDENATVLWRSPSVLDYQSNIGSTLVMVY